MVSVNTLQKFSHNDTSCPARWSDSHMALPSTTLACAVFALLCLVFALVIGIRYNTVRVFNRRFYTRNTTINALWIFSYFLAGTCATLLTIHHALRDDTMVRTYDRIYFLIFYIVSGFQAAALATSVNMQRKFKSVAPVSAQTSAPTDPLIPNGSPRPLPSNRFGITDLLIILVLIAYLVVFLVYSLHGEDTLNMSIAFIVIYSVQRALVPFFMFVLVASPNSQERTISPKSKIFIAISAVFHIPLVLPLVMWSWVFKDGGCLLYIGNATDLMVLPYIFSYIFLFLFIRSEYTRNMEQCIWDTVTQIQDNFDFRKFT